MPLSRAAKNLINRPKRNKIPGQSLFEKRAKMIRENY